MVRRSVFLFKRSLREEKMCWFLRRMSGRQVVGSSWEREYVQSVILRKNIKFGKGRFFSTFIYPFVL